METVVHRYVAFTRQGEKEILSLYYKSEKRLKKKNFLLFAKFPLRKNKNFGIMNPISGNACIMMSVRYERRSLSEIRIPREIASITFDNEPSYSNRLFSLKEPVF